MDNKIYKMDIKLHVHCSTWSLPIKWTTKVIKWTRNCYLETYDHVVTYNFHHRNCPRYVINHNFKHLFYTCHITWRLQLSSQKLSDNHKSRQFSAQYGWACNSAESFIQWKLTELSPPNPILILFGSPRQSPPSNIPCFLE